jgi:hypothetical protein
MEDSSHVFVAGKLYLFRRLFILTFACVDPLSFWQHHENQFPNVGFLTKQILEILGSQIKIDHVFSLTNVLTTLRHCHLQVENLYQIIMVVKIGLIMVELHAYCYS